MKNVARFRLYVWKDVMHDHTSGIAFAMAYNVFLSEEEAKKLRVELRKNKGQQDG